MQTIHSIKTSEMTGKAAKQYHCFVFAIMCHGQEVSLLLLFKILQIKHIFCIFLVSIFIHTASRAAYYTKTAMTADTIDGNYNEEEVFAENWED